MTLSLLVVLPLAAWMASSAPDPESAAYVKVEVKGQLETGIFAIGGETTGTQITAGPIVWELDLGGKAELTKLAESLNEQTVIVKGTLTKTKGVETGERWIVKVTELKAAAN